MALRRLLKVNLSPNEDLRNSFKDLETKCASIAELAGDAFDNENGDSKE